MLGKVSYVRLELDGQGGIASSAATTPDPATFVSPNYGTTLLCRTDPADRNSEPPNCRSYAIYIPSSYNGQTPLPLHLSLHGNGGFAEAQIGNIPKGDGTTNFALDNSGLEGRYNELAERHRFAVVYPNGRINAGETVQNGRNWNDCRKLNRVLRNGSLNTTYSDADDVGFINALLDDVSTALKVDAQRVYAHGYSNGAIMVLRLYQELGHRFAAFATNAGNMPVLESINDECALPFTAPKKPIQLMFGDLDYVVPYYGGCVLDGAQVPLASVPSLYCQRGNLMSADQTIDFFTAHLGAERPGPADMLWPRSWRMVHERIYTDGVPAVASGGEEPPDSGGRTAYSARVYGAGNSTGYFRDYRADDGGLVRVKKIQNGGHTLSGLRPVTNATTAALLGPKNLDTQLADELYAFFSQFDSRCGPRNVSLGPIYDQFTTRPVVFPWQMADDKNAFLQDDSVCFISRQSSAHLRGYLFAPRNLSQVADGSLPVVVIGPGSGNGMGLYYIWSARELAAQGYLVLVQDPQGLGRSETVGDPAKCGADGCPGVPFQNADSFVDGFQSALDYVESKNHPWLVKADLTRIGIAGHSLSARAATYAGGIDNRVKAVVAWDNMAGDLHGDEGTPSGKGACADLIGGELPGTSAPITPRVPTMGQASDANGTCNYEKNIALALGNDPELKKTGYEKWRAAGIPSMQLVFTGAAHGDWAQSGQSVAQQLESFEYFTRAWFDLYLKRDMAARMRLLAQRLQLSATALPIADVFSVKFRSAAFMPEARVDCADLVAVPCVPGPLLFAPVISNILDQIVDQGSAPLTLAFTISDADTPISALQVESRSSNVALVPASAMKIAGEGVSRTLTVTPVSGQSGTTTITVTVSDGARSTSDSFSLTVREGIPEVVPKVSDETRTGALDLVGLLPLTMLGGLRRRKKWLSVLAAVGLAACGSASAATSTKDSLVCEPVTLPRPSGAGSEIDGPPPAYDWQGDWQSCEVLFVSKMHGSQLYGVLFAPANLDLARDRLPVVVIAPGSATGVQAQYQWSARDLAGHGYIALTVDPQGVGRSEAVAPPQTADNYIDAVVSALDYLLSADNPLQANVDATRMGAAGHSLSARVVSFLQGEDTRLQAVVAWDNLSSTVEGDAGISSGGGACGSVIGGEVPLASRPARQRVPAMGQASDAPGGCTQDTDPEVKKTGYNTWRDAGIASMQIVVLDKAHADWAQSAVADADSASPKSKELELFQYYTRNWFDLYLKRDESARARLLAREVLTLMPDQVLSADFRSAAFIPEAGVDCADLLAEACQPKAKTVTAQAEKPQSRGLLLGAFGGFPLALMAVLAGLRRRR